MAKSTATKRRGKLLVRLLWLYVPITAGGMLALFLTAYLIGRPWLVERETAELQQQQLHSAALLINQHVEHIQEDLEKLSQLYPSGSANLDDEKRYLEYSLSREPYFREFSLIDMEGRPLVRVSPGNAFPPGKFRDASGPPSFPGTLEGRPFVSQAYLGSRGEPLMTVAAPWRRSGRVVGAVQAVVGLDSFPPELTALRWGETGILYLTDRDGRLLAHSDTVVITPGTSLIDRPTVLMATGGKRVTAFQDGSSYVNQRGEKVIASGQQLPGLEWVLIAEMEADEVFAPLNESIVVGGLIALGLLAGTTLATLLVSRTITRPLGQLNAATIVLASGNLEHRVKLETGDELEYLSDSFNAMAQQLQNSLGQFRSLVEAMPDGLSIYDRERRITMVNRQLANMLGYTPEEMVGMDAVSLVPKSEREAIANQISQRLAGKTDTYENHLLSKGGALIPVLISGAPRLGADGDIVGGFAILADIREIKKLQEEKARAEKLAALGQLTAIVAHELRNPLATISNTIYYLKARLGTADAKVARHLEAASRAIASSSRVMEDLLDYTRPKMPALQPASLNSLLEDAISRIATAEGVSVVRKFATDMPPLLCDGEMLRRVLVNIITNAFQAMPKGGILTITTQADGPWQEVAIADTGEGMALEVQAKLFHPLFSTKSKGVGLGLYISQQTVIQHGGTITVASEQSRGTTVTVRLPTGRES